MLRSRSESDGPRHPQPMGPYGGANNADPESPRRLVLLLGVLVAAGVVMAAGWLSAETGGALGAFAMVVWLWNERCIENQARRDLATDLAQNIHDGNLDASDLRRARGYPFIEDNLDRWDARPDREAGDE